MEAQKSQPPHIGKPLPVIKEKQHMKKYITILILSLGSFVCNAQCCYTINFDNGYYLDKIFIDTISNTNNSWKIGTPNKSFFQSAFSSPNAICTDLNKSYPSNDTSSFTISHQAEAGYAYYGGMLFSVKYRIDCDSINDYGIIEYSPDNGKTWINLITDTYYLNLDCYEWWSEKPILSGTKNDWQTIELYAGGKDIFNIDYYDTVKFKFTFISDSVDTDKDGWILDDFNFMDDGDSSIDDLLGNSFPSNVFPNPSTDIISIKYGNAEKFDNQILIYDNVGRIIEYHTDHSGEFNFSIKEYNDGLYFYRIINLDNYNYSFGKFIKN